MFQNLNKSASLMAKIQKAIKNGVALDKSYFEAQYLLITKTNISPLANYVLRAFDEGKIRLIYNKRDHVTVALPFVVLTIGGQTTACIFINEFSGMSKGDDMQLTIEMKKLYTLMESAYVASLYFTKPLYFTKNASFIKAMANIYSQMILRILNREYALSLDKDAFDTVNYTSARFFYERILGLTNPDLVHAYSVALCNNPSETTISLADNMYSAAKVRTIDEYVNYTAKSNPKMGDLKFRYFFERWVASYGTGATLAIDSFPYIYYCIANVLLGGFLINSTAMMEFIKNTRGINTLYSEIIRIIGA
jgi:hypothetical protein